ncbi:MAG: hypothetical protein WAX14_16305 [Rhodococcus sp. (in: high G+C Gram-positive bacteria)]|uniref:hypothetical protein n=1 Tax=Rhodococcus sp. TaxID=1831 RepID=UPI003BB7C583
MPSPVGSVGARLVAAADVDLARRSDGRRGQVDASTELPVSIGVAAGAADRSSSLSAAVSAGRPDRTSADTYGWWVGTPSRPADAYNGTSSA